MRSEYQLSPRILLMAGDPVKVAGRRGLFRFVGVYDKDGATYADVVGPVAGAEGLRTVPVHQLRSAGRTSKDRVAMSAEARELSRQAQAGRRKR